LLSHPFLFLLAICWALGLILLVAYLIETPGAARQWATMTLLLFLPSIGWGWWRHEKLVRAGNPAIAPRSSYVWSAMGTLHGLVLLVSLVAMLAMVFGAWHVSDPLGPDSIANRTNNATAAGFDLMLSGFGVMLGA